MLRTAIHHIALTRSHFCFPQGFRLARFKSVDLKRRPPKSLPWPPCLRKKANLPRSRKRPARTPPSTFLFLPIHFSNSPKPFGSVVPTPAPEGSRAGDAPPSDMAIAHGRMIHRVNSEGLRGRAIAPRGGAPKRPYIGFGAHYCQPSNVQIHSVEGPRSNNGARPNSLRNPSLSQCGNADLGRPGYRGAMRTSDTQIRCRTVPLI
jgi:hypothetical protein